MLENTEAGKAIKTGPSIETGNMSSSFSDIMFLLKLLVVCYLENEGIFFRGTYF
jgi:hypothetical protein